MKLGSKIKDNTQPMPIINGRMNSIACAPPAYGIPFIDKGPIQSKGKHADSTREGSTVSGNGAGGTPTAPLVQLKAAKVVGITHVVAKEKNSIYRGKEIDELHHDDDIDVDPGKRIRSRRGPNQEMVGDYDARGEHMYRWYHVNKTPKLGDVRQKEDYIREDTFKFVDPHHAPRVRALASQDTKRTRKSHVAVRFEVWYNDNYFNIDENHPHKKLDTTGHMVMKDYSTNMFTAYEMGEGTKEVAPVSAVRHPKIAEHDKTGIQVVDAGPFSTYKVLDARHEREEEVYRRLNAQRRVLKDDGVGVKPKPQGEHRPLHKRFNRKKSIEILVNAQEYADLKSRFEARKHDGFYCFYLEARTLLNYNLATRCLSVIEDLSLTRGMELPTGHAKEIIDKFAELSRVTVAHQSDERV